MGWFTKKDADAGTVSQQYGNLITDIPASRFSEFSQQFPSHEQTNPPVPEKKKSLFRRSESNDPILQPASQRALVPTMEGPKTHGEFIDLYRKNIMSDLSARISTALMTRGDMTDLPDEVLTKILLSMHQQMKSQDHTIDYLVGQLENYNERLQRLEMMRNQFPLQEEYPGGIYNPPQSLGPPAFQPFEMQGQYEIEPPGRHGRGREPWEEPLAPGMPGRGREPWEEPLAPGMPGMPMSHPRGTPFRDEEIYPLDAPQSRMPWEEERYPQFQDDPMGGFAPSLDSPFDERDLSPVQPFHPNQSYLDQYSELGLDPNDRRMPGPEPMVIQPSEHEFQTAQAPEPRVEPTPDAPISAELDWQQPTL